MSTILDTIGATIMASLIILAVINLNISLSETGTDTNVKVITQSNLTAIADGIKYDFYKIGFRASPAIIFADTSAIIFRSDLEMDGNPDTVHYWISTPLAGSGFNPNMRVLYRSVDGSSPTGASLGQTSFNLHYLDSTGTEISIPAGGSTDQNLLSQIKSIQIALMVQSPNVLISDSTYAGAYWVEHVSPKNLRTLM